MHIVAEYSCRVPGCLVTGTLIYTQLSYSSIYMYPIAYHVEISLYRCWRPVLTIGEGYATRSRNCK